MNLELDALKAILEDIGKRVHPNSLILSSSSSNSGSSGSGPHDISSILASAKACLGSILEELESAPKSSFKKTMQVTKWHFSKEDNQKHVDGLERIKSALILVLMTETSDTSRGLQQAMQDLTIDLRADRKAREDTRTQQHNEKLLTWLSPVDPAEENGRVYKVRQAGTGDWFIDGPSASWDAEKKRRMLCLNGKCKFFSAKLSDWVVAADREQS